MESLPKEEISCVICLLMICEPVQLNCSHFFCKYCLEKLKENDPNDFICPLCRNPIAADFKIITNKALENEFWGKYKEEYAKRIQDVEKLRKEDNVFEKAKFIYGNSHQNLQIFNKNNSHQWTFFIKGDAKSKYKIKDLIKKVDVELDPSFGGVVLTMRSDPFELTRKGFGEFTLVFKIFWQKWLKMEPLALEHHLNFQKDLTQKVHILKFNKELIKQTIIKN